MEHRKLAEKKDVMEGRRSSERIKRKKEQAYSAVSRDRPVPKNFQEALESKDRKYWERAMDEELGSIIRHQVYDLVDREKNTEDVPM